MLSPEYSALSTEKSAEDWGQGTGDCLIGPICPISPINPIGPIGPINPIGPIGPMLFFKTRKPGGDPGFGDIKSRRRPTLPQ